MRRLLVIPFLALTAGACERHALVCAPAPNELRAAFQSSSLQAEPVAVLVTVVDSVTGQNLTAGATGYWVRGTVADSLRHAYDGRLAGMGAAGRYSVVVQHPGYDTWGMDDVRVRWDGCSPEPAMLTARLRPTITVGG